MYDLAAIAHRRCLLRLRLPDPAAARPRLMSAGDAFGLVVSLLVLAYLVYALFRGREVLGERSGHRRRSSSTRSRSSRSPIRSGSGWRAIYGAFRASPGASLRRGRARLLPARRAATPSASRTGRATARRCSSSACSSGASSTRSSACRGTCFLNPDHMKGVPAAPVAEHGRELHHEHELAVLRRRVHDVVPDPDGGARGAELRLGRRRHRRARGGRSAGSRGARPTRSGTSGSTSTARSSTSCCRSRSSSRRFLIWQGVPQTLHGHATATTLQGATQTIARGPVASQIAIKQLGTNGGGFYNSNSAVPFENPNGLSNFIEMLGDPADPGGRGVHVREDGARPPARLGGVRGDVRRCSRSASRSTCPAEQHGSAGAARLGGEPRAERRARAAATWPTRRSASARRRPRTWAVATSDASNGVGQRRLRRDDARGRSCAPRQPLPRRGDLRRGRLGPLRDVLLHRDRGVRRRADGRSHAGVARARRSRRARSSTRRSGALFAPTMVLTLTAISIVTKSGLASIYNPGVHGFTETLYAYDSQSNNNGSAFAGFGLTNFSADFGTVAMLLGRFVPDVRRARARRLAREEEDRPGLGRHVPHRRRRRSSCCCRRDRAHRRADDPSRRSTLGPIVEGLMH